MKKLSLNPVFFALLCVFTAVSAYVTFLFTSSLAEDELQKVAFSALGLSFDILKCFLPATILLCGWRNFGKGFVALLVYLLLMSFSFYASYDMLDRARIKRVQGTVAYQALDKQLKGLQASYDGLVKLERITKANEQYGDKIEATANKMSNMLSAGLSLKDVLSNKDFLMSIVLAILLELSVLACHISMVIRTQEAVQNNSKLDKKDASKNAHVDARTKNEQGIGYFEASVSHNATDLSTSARSSVYKVSASELAALLKNNGDEELSYRKITAKYGVRNSDTIKQAKVIISSEIAQKDTVVDEDNISDSDLCLLPSYS